MKPKEIKIIKQDVSKRKSVDTLMLTKLSKEKELFSVNMSVARSEEVLPLATVEATKEVPLNRKGKSCLLLKISSIDIVFLHRHSELLS